MQTQKYTEYYLIKKHNWLVAYMLTVSSAHEQNLRVGMFGDINSQIVDGPSDHRPTVGCNIVLRDFSAGPVSHYIGQA